VTHARRTVLVVVLVLAGVVAGCARSEVVDFGAPVPEGAPPLPADRGLEVAADADLALAPPVGAVLAPGGWPAVEAFVAREAAQGRPTVVNLFASWCGPCAREMPLIVAASVDEPGIVFLGVAHLDAAEDARTFVEAEGIVFTSVLDLDGEVAYAIGSRGMPTTVAFDRSGRLVARVIGELTPASLEQLLAAVR
jgi:thiol-disulfide isomerase/thioredoxin